MAKRYYWLKLPDDFFRQKPIKKLRKIAGGDTYTVIYLKMLLISLKNDGKLYFDGVEDNFCEELALELDEEEEKDIIDFLAGLKRFYRNSFLKNLLRGYLAGPATYVYEEQPVIKEVEERSTVIKDNILGIEKLPQMKKRKKREKHIILTEDQKKLLDPTASGLFDDVDIIIKK